MIIEILGADAVVSRASLDPRQEALEVGDLGAARVDNIGGEKLTWLTRT